MKISKFKFIALTFIPLSVFSDNLSPKLFSKLESQYNGRLGVSATNTSNNQTIDYRSNEAFPFCSTSKLMVVAATLKHSETESNLLQKQLKYSAEDIKQSGYAPITKNNLTTGMNVSQLCEAALDYSDNLAMNLLIHNIGGIASINSFAKSIGDNSFRLDRLEPKLNSAIPNDERDTTKPRAMKNSLQKVTIGNYLQPSQQNILQNLLKNNTTGDLRIRAGTPKGWTVGDKTGTGSYGTTNDIGIIWPEKCKPIVIAIYFTQNNKKAQPNDKIIESATRIIIQEFAKTDSCLKKSLSN